MAKFKKVDDLIGAFLDFNILEDEMPVATTDEEGNVVVMTRAEYAEFLERKNKAEASENETETGAIDPKNLYS